MSMNTDSKRCRIYRALCIAAIVHAAVSLAMVFLVSSQGTWIWLPRLWVGLTTLWFFWPIIIALHAGRTARLAYLSTVASAVLLVLPIHGYLTLFAPSVLISENGPQSFHPYDVGLYLAGFVNGSLESIRCSRVRAVRVEGYGLGFNAPGMPPLADEAARKYNIKQEPIAGCVIDSYIHGHAVGWNAISARVLKRRHGADIMNVLEREWTLEQERLEAARPAGRADAERDIRAGNLTLKVLDQQSTAEPPQSDMSVLVQHGVTVSPIINGMNAPRDILGHAFAYNWVVEEEIKRRFGPSVAVAIEDEIKRRYLYIAGSP